MSRDLALTIACYWMTFNAGALVGFILCGILSDQRDP